METSPPVYFKQESPNSFFRNRYTATFSFGIGILLFLLPFVQLKCSSVSIAENSGIGLVMGSNWKINMGGAGDLFKNLSDSKTNSERKMLKIDPDWFLLLAVVFAMAGILFSISHGKIRNMACLSAGLLAAVMMIAAMIHLKVLLRSQMPSGNKNDGLEMNMGGIVRIQFTIWYFLSLASFAAGSFFSYRHHKIEEQDAINNFVDFDFQREPG